MSNLKARLAKLEASIPAKPKDLHIMRFIVDCSGIEPMGYRCGDVEIMRETGESEGEFKNRCNEAVYWPDGVSRHVFDPIYSD